jgi:dTDP-4-dehydrorhamnose reductase
MRILITGASGLVGLNLALEAANRGPLKNSGGETGVGEGPYEIFGTVNSHPVKTQAFEVIISDLLAQGEPERLIDNTQPDWVINCAALAIVDACENEPELAKRLNIELPQKLATYVTRGGARLVHLSTDAVFDGIRGDYTEDDHPNPLSLYAKTKLAGERAVLDTNPDAIVARINVFGWSLSGSRSLAEWFYYNLAASKQVMGFTDVYFCPLLVNDLAHVLLQMLSGGLKGLYHVVSQECSSKYDFGVSLARIFGLDETLIKPSSIDEADLKAVRSNNLTLRSDRLANALGSPLPTLREGLHGFHELYQAGYPERLKQMKA